MARKPRVEYAGAFYHVIVQAISAKSYFAATPTANTIWNDSNITAGDMAFRVYAYVLMSNHVHMLVETGHVPLSKIIAGVGQAFVLLIWHGCYRKRCDGAKAQSSICRSILSCDLPRQSAPGHISRRRSGGRRVRLSYCLFSTAVIEGCDE